MKKLTDVFLRSVPVPKKGRTEIRDTSCRGLSLRITPNGARSWSFRYTTATGRPARVGLGRYPDMPLLEARRKADELRTGVANGSDPIAEKRQARVEAGEKTFGHLAERYMAEHARRKKRSADQDEALLRLHVLPEWGHVPYTAIARADAIGLIEGIITKKERPTTGNRVGALLSKVFNFAIDAGLADRNPCARLAHRAENNVKTRTLTDDELKLFWTRTGNSPRLSPQVGLCLRCLLLLGLRSSEAAELRRDELINFNGKNPAILLSGERTKNKRPHFLPLGPLAKETIAEALKLANDTQTPFVFPSPAAFGTSIDKFSLVQSMARFSVGFRDSKEPGAVTWVKHAPTPHDLRRTLRTRLSALRVPREICDRVLNHAPTSVGDRHYNQHEFADEKREALERWERMLQSIVDGASLPNVVSFNR